MSYIFFLLIGYAVLYIVVWLHEIGHAIFDCKFGVKDCWYKVNVKPYIFFSTPGQIDSEKLQTLSKGKLLAIAYGGILVNSGFAILMGILIMLLPVSNIYISFAMWLFLTLHLAEIVSYLFIGSLYPVSDMQIVQQVKPSLRIPDILVGGLIGVIYVMALCKLPIGFKTDVLVWNIITILCMAVGRIIFTIIYSKKAKK